MAKKNPAAGNITQADKDAAAKAAADRKAAADKAAAERKEQREKEAAAKEAAIKAAKKELAPAAKEINTFLELADKNDSKANDQRLAAALKLAEVEKAIKLVPGMSMKVWCAENIKDKSYETVRKLVAVGQSGDESKARIALEDMRAKNAAANRKARTKAKVTKTAAKKGGQNIGADPKSGSGKTLSPWKTADNAIAALPEEQALELVKGRAHKLGMALVSEADAKSLKGGKDWNSVADAFDKLSLDGKMKVIDHIERKMSGKFETKA